MFQLSDTRYIIYSSALDRATVTAKQTPSLSAINVAVSAQRFIEAMNITSANHAGIHITEAQQHWLETDTAETKHYLRCFEAGVGYPLQSMQWMQDEYSAISLSDEQIKVILNEIALRAIEHQIGNCGTLAAVAWHFLQCAFPSLRNISMVMMKHYDHVLLKIHDVYFDPWAKQIIAQDDIDIHFRALIRGVGRYKIYLRQQNLQIITVVPDGQQQQIIAHREEQPIADNIECFHYFSTQEQWCGRKFDPRIVDPARFESMFTLPHGPLFYEKQSHCLIS